MCIINDDSEERKTFKTSSSMTRQNNSLSNGFEINTFSSNKQKKSREISMDCVLWHTENPEKKTQWNHKISIKNRKIYIHKIKRTKQSTVYLLFLSFAEQFTNSSDASGRSVTFANKTKANLSYEWPSGVSFNFNVNKKRPELTTAWGGKDQKTTTKSAKKVLGVNLQNHVLAFRVILQKRKTLTGITRCQSPVYIKQA